MAEGRIRDLDDEVAAALKHQTRHHGSSVVAEAHDILTEAVRRPRRELLARLDALRSDVADSGGYPSKVTRPSAQSAGQLL